MNSVIICFVGLYFAIVVNTVSGWKCANYDFTCRCRLKDGVTTKEFIERRLAFFGCGAQFFDSVTQKYFCVESVPTDKFVSDAARHGVMNAPFNFAYLSSSEFNSLMQLKNVSPKITAIKVVVETDDPASKSKYEWDRDEGDHFRLCGELSFNKVTIGLELYSSSGLCATKVVSEGRHARILQHGVADSTYESGHFCLNFLSTACGIDIDLRNYCTESKINRNATRGKTFNPAKETHYYSNTTRNTSTTPTRKIYVTPKPKLNIPDTNRKTSNTPKPTITYIPKATQNISHATPKTSITPKPKISHTPNAPQNIPHTTQNTSVTPKPKISHTPKAPQNVSDTSKSTRNLSNTSNATLVVWDITDTLNTTLNLSDTSTATWYTSGTPNATVIGRNDAVVKKYTIIIVSAIFGMALILLVLIAIWKRCWFKRNPSGTPEILPNDQNTPFYLNLLFRRECKQEIELIEQHHYEEINPQ